MSVLETACHRTFFDVGLLLSHCRTQVPHFTRKHSTYGCFARTQSPTAGMMIATVDDAILVGLAGLHFLLGITTLNLTQQGQLNCWFCLGRRLDPLRRRLCFQSLLLLANRGFLFGRTGLNKKQAQHEGKIVFHNNSSEVVVRFGYSSCITPSRKRSNPGVFRCTLLPFFLDPDHALQYL